MNGTYIEASTANFNRGRGGSKIDLIVLHTMDGFFNGTISWFKNPASKASSHFVVGKEGQLVQMVPMEDTAWHATNADVNKRSIGIEHEDGRKPFEVRPDALYESSAQIVAEVSQKFGIPLDRTHVLKHSEVYAGKPNCPGGLDVDRIINRARQLVGQGPHVSEPAGSLAITPHNRNVSVAVDKGLNVRSYPDTKLKNITRIIPVGSTFPVEGYAVGESVSGNNFWWKLKNEVGFVWSGGTNVVPQPTPEAPVVPVSPTPPPPVTPVPPVAENIELIKLQNKALTDENKRLNENIGEANTNITDLQTENNSLRDELSKFGDLNFETVKNANEALTEQNKILMQKNKDLEAQRNDAFIQAFKGWKLAEVPEGSKGMAAVLSFATKMLGFNKKSHYVVGYKEGARLYKVGEEKPATPAQDVTQQDLKGAA